MDTIREPNGAMGTELKWNWEELNCWRGKKAEKTIQGLTEPQSNISTPSIKWQKLLVPGRDGASLVFFPGVGCINIWFQLMPHFIRLVGSTLYSRNAPTAWARYVSCAIHLSLLIYTPGGEWGHFPFFTGSWLEMSGWSWGFMPATGSGVGWRKTRIQNNSIKQPLDFLSWLNCLCQYL